jgi:serine/threonine protein kinase
MGTAGYMSPEQVRGLAVDHRSDIFAFGAVLYELISGQRAFRGDTMMDIATAILKEDPPDLPTAERHIPPALTRIVERCLAKTPGAVSIGRRPRLCSGAVGRFRLEHPAPTIPPPRAACRGPSR